MRWRAATTRWSSSDARSRAISGSGTTRSAPLHAGFSASPGYEDARDIASSLLAPFEAGELDLVQTVYTRFISAGRQEVIVRPLLPLDEEGFEGGRTAASAAAAQNTRAAGLVRVRTEPGGHPQRAAAALRAGACLRRVAQRRGGGARRPPARDEGCDRQRRRVDPRPEPRHEPRPSGRDHHRDHGNRRRCGGAAGRRQRRRRSRAIRLRWGAAALTASHTGN